LENPFSEDSKTSSGEFSVCRKPPGWEEFEGEK